MTRRLHRFFLFGLIVLFSARLHAQTVIESAFSPDDRAEALILKVIDSSKENLRLAAYAFTSPPVMKSLLAAKKRGVDVKIVVDERQPFQGKQGGHEPDGQCEYSLAHGFEIPHSS